MILRILQNFTFYFRCSKSKYWNWANFANSGHILLLSTFLIHMKMMQYIETKIKLKLGIILDNLELIYLQYIYLYFACLDVCLSVCLYPIKEKTGKLTPGKFYNWSKLKNFTRKNIKVFFVENIHITDRKILENFRTI